MGHLILILRVRGDNSQHVHVETLPRDSNGYIDGTQLERMEHIFPFGYHLPDGEVRRESAETGIGNRVSGDCNFMQPRKDMLFISRVCVSVCFRRMRRYGDKEDIRNFLVHLANATYFTFQYVPEMSTEIVPPSRYMELIFKIRYNLKYVLSNSNMEMFNVTTLDMTITELGICYSYNSHVAAYNSYS